MEQDIRSEIFMLIDGSAIVHRAYHAMPQLTSSDGTPTGAVQGFFSMILKMIQQLRPAHIAVAFDRPAPNFRKELFSGYQSQRPSVDSVLSPQFGIIQEILVKAKIPIYSEDGLEADDIIGTLSSKLTHNSIPIKSGSKLITQNLMVYIITGDRDMLQLVNDKTKVLAPIKGISEMTLFDAEKVREKYGINPSEFIEMKALMGDPSDNYPGVAGVGPKTASTLINEYKTIDNIYKNIGKIEEKNPKLAQKLIDNEKNARLAHQLATILTDAPFEYDFLDCDMKNLSIDGLRQALLSYDMTTLPKRLDEVFGKDGKITPDKMGQMKLL